MVITGGGSHWFGGVQAHTASGVLVSSHSGALLEAPRPGEVRGDGQLGLPVRVAGLRWKLTHLYIHIVYTGKVEPLLKETLNKGNPA